MKPTLRMVAAETGLHPSTVSRILNGHVGRTSAATQARVLEAAQRLAYQPNLAARALRTNRTMTIGLVAPDLTDPVFAQIHAAAEAVARRFGYHVLLATVDSPHAHTHTDLDYLLARGVDGLLLASAEVGDPILSRLPGMRIPYVLVNRTVAGDHPSITADDRLGGYFATKHLLELGHRDVAFVGGTPRTSTAERRLAGFRAALAEAGIAVDERHVLVGDFGTAHAMGAAAQILAFDSLPTGIVVVDDMMALAVRRVLVDGGLRVPEDVSITGYNDLPVAALAEPPLTTIRNFLDRIGEIAATRLIAAMDSGSDPESMVLTPELVVRRSCAPPPLRKVR
jgi:LacI family transcriptional regulator